MEFNPDNAVEDFNPENAVEDFNPDNAVEDSPRAVNLRQINEDITDKDIENRRFAIMDREAAHNTLLGLTNFRKEAGEDEFKLLKMYKDNPEANKHVKPEDLAKLANLANTKYTAARGRRKAELEELHRLPDFMNVKNEDTFSAAMKSLGGTLWGGMKSPEAFFPVGKGATALKTFGKGAAVGGITGGGVDLLTQRLDQELGLSDNIDWMQFIQSVGSGGFLGGATNTAGYHGSVFKQAEGFGPSGEAIGAGEAKAIEAAELLKARQAAKRPMGSAGASEDIDAAQARDVPEGFNPDNAYPEIKEEFRVDKPLDESQASYVEESKTAPEGTYPEILDNNAPLEYPKIERGFGPDVTVEEVPLRGNQHGIIPGALADEANFDGMQGTHKMDFPYDQPHSEDSIHLDNQNISEGNVVFADAIRNAKTMGEALDIVAKTGGDSYEAQMARAILKAAPETNSQPLQRGQLLGEGQAGVVKTQAITGIREYELDTRAMLYDSGPEVVIHEATHVKTNDALYAHAAGNATPEQAAYAQKVEDLFKHILNKRPDLARSKWMKNLNEFNAYGLTDAQFIDVLDGIKYRGTSVWDKLLSYARDLLGLDPKYGSVFKELVKGMSDWDKIQGTNKSRGESIFRLQGMQGAETPMLLGMPEHVRDAYEKKIKAHFNRFESPDEARLYLEGGGDMQDLPGLKKLKWSGVVTTQNQLAMMSDKNPIIAHAFNHLFARARQEDVRMFGYDEQVKGAIEWAEQNPKDAVAFFKEWERLNVDPSQSELRSQLAADPRALEAHFQSMGVQPDIMKIMKPFIDVMADVHGSDGKALEGVGRKLNNEALYFPLGRQGPFHFTVTDDMGQVIYAGGHRTLGEAKLFSQKIKETMPEGHTVSEVVRTDPTRILNSAIQQAMLQQTPEWFHKMSMDHYEAKLEYRRNFEKGRSNIEVGGYIGELDPKTPKELKKRLDEYLDSFSHRVRESHHLGNSAAAVELSRALLSPGTPLDDFPNTKAWLTNMISRHVGIDTSKWGWSDDLLQGSVERVGKVLTKIDGLYRGYKPGVNDNVVAPNIVKASLQAFSSLASMWKITLSPQVLGGNAVSNAMMFAYGARDMARMGLPQHHAMAAQVDALAYMATFGRSDHHAWVRDKMKQAKKEGLIDPHGREDYSAVENIDRFHMAGKGTEGVTDAAVRKTFDALQKPRDWIEAGTNWNAIMYNHFLVKRALPDLPEAQHDEMVYNLARSFAGDYSKQGNLFLFEKMGSLGHLGSNFAKWKFNRTSRYIDDLIMASSTSEYGVKGVLPLLWSIGIGGVMAGVYGSVGVVEYEALRRLFQSSGLAETYPAFDWKPLSAILEESGLLSDMDTNAKSIVERGMVTGFSDHVAQQFGQSSGPDISGSIREASLLEAPMVAINVATEMVGAAGLALKYGLSRKDVTEFVDSLPEGTVKKIAKSIQTKPSYGLTTDDGKKAVRALPTVVQEMVREQFAKKIEVDGETKYVVPELAKDQGSYIRSEFQQRLARSGGLKTTDETRFNEAKQYDKYLERHKERDYTALKDGIINNMDDLERVDRNAKMILEEHGEKALERAIAELEKIATEKMQTDYFGIKRLAATKARDGIAAQKAAERMKRSMKLWKPE
jgi:hypothetical protein